MSNATACPDVSKLQELLQGQLTDEETFALEQHLRSCERCASAFQTLTDKETPPSGIRAKGLPVPQPVVTPDVPVQVAPNADAEAEADPEAEALQELHDFLSPPQTPDELGRLGHYRVLRVLGAGGMGVVFQAEDLHLKRMVALKAMKPSLAASESSKKRFLREAQAAAGIEHDHIITIFQVGEDRGVPFLAMPLLKGETLDDRLNREGKLPVPEVLRIGREIAEGLAAAHERGLMHRDIKPANIWLEGTSGRVKLLDFGLARGQTEARLTTAGAIMGTPAYMAPEQASGGDIDHRCDLFSLGSLLYHASSGHLPFPGGSGMAMVVTLLTTNPKPLRKVNPDLPPALETLVMQLLTKNPSNRPQAARSVIQAIRTIERDVEMRASALVRRPTTPVGGMPAEPLPEAMAPGTKLGSYEITAHLAVDRVGMTYSARDNKHSRDVILKVFHSALTQDANTVLTLQQEMQALTALNHPNVACIYGLEDIAGQYAFVSEAIAGRSLAEWLATEPVPAPEAISFCRQLADALQAAHEKGVTHHDVRPQNVIVTKQGKVKLINFVPARLVPAQLRGTDSWSAASGFETPADSMVPTTPAYMSPELMRGKPLDPKTDVWSFGCVLFELLSGGQPFRGETATDVVASVLASEPDWNALPKNTPLRLRNLLQYCFKKDREWRPQDMKQVKNELDAAAKEVGGPPVVAGPDLAAELPPVFPGRRKASPLLFLLLLLVLLGGAAWYFQDQLLGLLHFGSKGGGKRLAAVLSFDAPRDDPALEKVADGLAKSVSSHLSQSPELRGRITTYEQVLAFKDKQGLYPWRYSHEAGQLMGVGKVLRGKVALQDGTLTVEAWLIDSESEQETHREQFKRPLPNPKDPAALAAAQEELAKELAARVQGWLLGAKGSK